MRFLYLLLYLTVTNYTGKWIALFTRGSSGHTEDRKSRTSVTDGKWTGEHQLHDNLLATVLFANAGQLCKYNDQLYRHFSSLYAPNSIITCRIHWSCKFTLNFTWIGNEWLAWIRVVNLVYKQNSFDEIFKNFQKLFQKYLSIIGNPMYQKRIDIL